MVGSTGTIMTMRLLRNKQHKRDETAATSATTIINPNVSTSSSSSQASSNMSSAASVSVAATVNNISNKNKQQRHNNSITSATSSASTSSTSSSSSSSSSSSTDNNGNKHHHHQHHNNHHHNHHHHHHRSLSMREHALDMPYDGAADDGISQYQPAIAYLQSPASVWVFPPLPPQPNLFCNNNQDALIQFEKAGLKGFRKQFSGRFKRFVLRKPAEPAPAIPPELKCQLKTIFVY